MDKRSYDVSIDVDGKSKMLRIAPGATLERLCSNKACKLKLVDVADGVYTLEGNETVKIDGALVYYADAFVSKEGSNATLKDVKPKVAPKTDAPSQK
ncbi:MAG: hypothetical protein ACRBCJ_00540 [Hyphomicrobiaceae bacterium]